MDWRERMNRAVEYIEENLSGSVDLDAAARAAGCSRWEFQRVFSFLAHVPLGEYIRRRRLALAARELRESGAKVVDIALGCGYESAAAFARAFHQAYGMSPTDARAADAGLAPYPRIAFEDNLQGRLLEVKEQNDMMAYGDRGYYVKENAPVYFTRDMDKTCAWFRDVLGWYGDIVARGADGRGEYGCVFDYPGELIVAKLTPFRGIHLFYGEPTQGVAGFIMVQGLDRFRSVVLDNGWKEITEIAPQSWDARECRVTTIDGSILRFFETGD